MTPKEDAQSLWLEYYELLPDGIYSTQAAKIEAKKYALIAVDKIIASNPHIYFEKIGYSGTGRRYSYKVAECNLKYWQQVKTEIENL
jgi:hypothetical protein